MGRDNKHQTEEERKAARALVNRNNYARKAAEEHNLLSRHPDQTAVLSRGQARKRFLEEIKADRVQLLPLPIPIIPEMAGNDEHCEDIESGMNYLIDKLIKENEERSVEGLWREDNSLRSSDDDLPTLQQLASRRLGIQSIQTSSIPDKTQPALKPQDQKKSKK